MNQRLFSARTARVVCLLSLLVFANFIAAQAQNVYVQYATTSDYGSGFTGEIKINNAGPQAVNGWNLSFDLARSISSVYNANVVSHVGIRYTFTNANFNSTIAAGDSLTVGIVVTGSSLAPTNFAFNGVSVGSTPPSSLTSSTFTYQGRLSEGSAPANAAYDLQFALYDEAGTQIGTALTRENVAVTNGIFTVQLDFGAAAFSGANRVLEVRVRPGAETGAFTTLSPRQPITAAPYSVRALNATNADNAVNATTATNSQQLGGVTATNFAQTNSTAFIRNQTTQQSAANFNIGGNGTLGGTLSAAVVNANTQYNIGGSRVLSAVSGTSNNTFVGFGTGAQITSGALNVFVGEAAGISNTTGNTNSFVGVESGRLNLTGNSNSVFGYRAGFINQEGSNNSFFGAGAGAGNGSGSGNTIIGAGANVAANNLTFATAIGSGAVVSDNNSVVLGRAADTVQIPGSLVVAGTIAGGCRSGFTAFSNGRLCVSAMQSAATFWNAVNVCKDMSARVGNSADVMLTFSDTSFNYFGGLASGWLADHIGDDTWGTWNVASPNSNFDGASQPAGSTFLPFRCVY